ncbi:hypothetical protein [Nocardia sp. XZ_19_369]|uniref:hypothetical protein n=1 Tax=Nocardia sp. XZ_19_369 TaxID=2769487 RepID=UPI00188F5AED|nr:hypothetical protein [Nocardia sp. XZ_19_369]
MNHRPHHPSPAPSASRTRRARLERALSLALLSLALGLFVMAAVLPVLVLTSHRAPAAQPGTLTASQVSEDGCVMFCTAAEKPTLAKHSAYPGGDAAASYPGSAASAAVSPGCWTGLFCTSPPPIAIELGGGSGSGGWQLDL